VSLTGVAQVLKKGIRAVLKISSGKQRVVRVR
jgi:hypothetical protein